MNQIVVNLPKKNDALSAVNMDVDLLGKIGNLQVRLARDASEIEAAQRIRFDVFYREFGASGVPSCLESGLDHDYFDAHCDHLVVSDNSLPGSTTDKIIGTYRLMQDHHALSAGGYYSAGEFAIASLMTRHSDRKFLELGRSCVLKPYRSKRTVELLWQGIWAYAQHHNIDVMLGCASFSGTMPAQHAETLSFLHHHAKTTGEWHVAPLPGRHICMDLMPAEAISVKSAIHALPPLIKGYLRLGAAFGDGAVVDREFNTTDVLVVLPVENISERYRAHYGENADRFAA